MPDNGGGGRPQQRARGGGFPGRPQGTDRIPAWLSQGEFVVNAQATKQFLPLLKALNSGNVSHMNQGGQVTNVGDINVSVQGGDTAQATIHAIAQGLNREMRAGRIKIG